MDKIFFPHTPLVSPSSYGGAKTESKNRDKKKVSAGQKTLFANVLEMLQPSLAANSGDIPDLFPSEETVQKLLDHVHSAGDDLKNNPSPEEILRYKAAVRNFLRYVAANAYTLEEQNGIPRSQKPGFKGSLWSEEAKERKKFHLVRIIDQKLEQLAANVLSNQIAQIDLLARLEEITGLLVDLME